MRKPKPEKRPRSEKKPLSRSDKLAILALIVAFISILFSVYTVNRQNKQWDAVNLSRIKVVDIDFVAWATMPKDKALATTWGYEVFARPLLESRIVKDEILINCHLVPFDSVANKNLFEIAGLTLSEVQENLQRHNISSKGLIIRKHFQIEFDFENVGATDARQVQVSVQAQLPDSSEWTTDAFSQPVDVAPGKRIERIFDLFTDPRTPFPEKLHFATNVRFLNANGDQVNDQQPFYFVSSTSSWKFGE